jgi:hypothetical protein
LFARSTNRDACRSLPHRIPKHCNLNWENSMSLPGPQRDSTFAIVSTVAGRDFVPQGYFDEYCFMRLVEKPSDELDIIPFCETVSIRDLLWDDCMDHADNSGRPLLRPASTFPAEQIPPRPWSNRFGWMRVSFGWLGRFVKGEWLRRHRGG